MKRIEYNKYIIIAFVAVVLTGLLSSCATEMRPDSRHNPNTDGRLFVNSTVSDAVVITRAPSDVEKKEKQLNTLDVFVQRTSDGKFIGQYHLPYPDGQPVQEQVNNFLADYWRDEGIEAGKTYNVYIATNNPKSAAVQNLDNFDPSALVFNEVTEGIAVLDADNNIGWVNDTTSGNIFKLYDANAGANPTTSRALTKNKEFMMDGVLKNWTPNTSSQDQVFEVTLNRAASKFVLNLKFDKTFLRTLTENMKISDTGDTTWTEKPDAEKIAITGSPAWKFYNFAFGAPVFEPETQGAGVEIHNSGFNIIHNQGYAGDEKSFSITTYSYPNSWAKADYATKAPSMVVSVGFTQGTGDAAVTTYHYYRIPLVKNTITAIERNRIYVVNATIATRGSSAQEDQDVTEDIEYAVLPWNDQSNSEVIENNVVSVQHYYFNVNPKVYTLRGDGDQSVTLNYSKASGTKVSWKLFEIDPVTEEKGDAVPSSDPDAVWGWFYNSTGNMMTEYEDSSTTDWDHMGVSIVQSSEGTSGSKGTVTVTSTALNNKAIKYMLLRVYLDEEETFDPQGNPTMYEDIIIRHFPTDNIQNIEGLWSTYRGASATQTLTTRSLDQAQQWATQYGVDYTATTIDIDEFVDYEEYAANASDTEHYHMIGPNTVTYDQFHAAVQSRDDRQRANSQANAVADAGEGNTYYWGTDPVVVATGNNYSGDYDYRTGNGNNRRYYKYSNYYSASYTHIDSYTQYTVTYTTEAPSTWVDWTDQGWHSPQRTYAYSYNNTNNNRFIAKVYQNGAIYYIEEESDGSWYNPDYRTVRGDRVNNLSNQHMYVIQISSTSDEYVLGRPYINSSTHQSQDNVVSPAFMIASQLGAVTPFNATQGATYAAQHCDRYVEVTPDGKRYSGWRLPTTAEISVITGYQYGNIGGVRVPEDYRVLTPVLTGMYYWSLSGDAVVANSSSTNTTKSYLRCVRDLSAEEVDELNGFDKIQEKYR